MSKFLKELWSLKFKLPFSLLLRNFCDRTDRLKEQTSKQALVLSGRAYHLLPLLRSKLLCFGVALIGQNRITWPRWKKRRQIWNISKRKIHKWRNSSQVLILAFSIFLLTMSSMITPYKNKCHAWKQVAWKDWLDYQTVPEYTCTITYLFTRELQLFLYNAFY